MTLVEAINKYNELAIENQALCDFHKERTNQDAHIIFRNKAKDYRDLTTFLIDYQNLKEEHTAVMYITPKMNGACMMCYCGKCEYVTTNRQDDNFCSNCGVKFINKIKTINPYKDIKAGKKEQNDT